MFMHFANMTCTVAPPKSKMIAAKRTIRTLNLEAISLAVHSEGTLDANKWQRKKQLITHLLIPLVWTPCGQIIGVLS